MKTPQKRDSFIGDDVAVVIEFEAVPDEPHTPHDYPGADGYVEITAVLVGGKETGCVLDCLSDTYLAELEERIGEMLNDEFRDDRESEP